MGDRCEIKNTFTVGKIGLDLNETDIDEDGNTKKNQYKLVPGGEYIKNPAVTVEAGSDECYVRMMLHIHNSSAVRDIVVNSKNGMTTFVDMLGGLELDAWKMSNLTQDRQKDTVTYEFRYKTTVSGRDKNGRPLTKDIKLEPLFEKLLIPENLTHEELETLEKGGFKITVEAQAVQQHGHKNASAAWAAYDKGHGLTAAADPAENTFTYGEIKTDLSETDTKDDNDNRTNTYTFAPGSVIAKDPRVTVNAGSESCWLFAEVAGSDTLDTFLSYQIADGWTLLEGAEGIYFRQVEASSHDQSFQLLKDNVVSVLPSVTQDDLDALNDADCPWLEVTAYAVQQNKVETPAEAWEITATETHLQDRTEPVRNSFAPVRTEDHDLNVKVTGDCELLGRDWQEGDTFLFMLQMWDDESGTWVTKGTQSVVHNAENDFRSFDFSHLVIHQLTEAKYYFFRIAEGRGNLQGVSYDTGIREFMIHVTADENGIMSIAEVMDMENTAVNWNPQTGNFEVAVKFANTYVKPHEPPVMPEPEPVAVDLQIGTAVKNVGDREIGPDGFCFQLEKNSTGETWTAVSDENGVAAFHMSYSSADTGKVYIYELSEIDSGRPGVTYDSREYEIRVGITLDERSNVLVPVISIDGRPVSTVEVEFVNIYDSADDPIDPSGPGNPDEPGEPSEPDVPTEPGEPDKPDEPGEPSEPSEPSEPDNPGEPDVPSEPDGPTKPTDPDEPSEPENPGKPDNPGEPSEPEDPTDPDKPDDPSAPDNPWFPVDPSEPSEPTLPDVPTEPVGPAVPSKPDLPLDPDPSAGGGADPDQDGQSAERDYGTQTGDNFTVLLYLILLLTSAVIMILLVAGKPDRKNI